MHSAPGTVANDICLSEVFPTLTRIELAETHGRYLACKTTLSDRLEKK